MSQIAILAARQDEIRARFGAGDLMFDALPNNKGCRIEVRLLGPKISDETCWDQAIDWMVDTQERLRAAVAAGAGVPKSFPPPPQR